MSSCDISTFGTDITSKVNHKTEELTIKEYTDFCGRTWKLNELVTLMTNTTGKIDCFRRSGQNVGADIILPFSSTVKKFCLLETLAKATKAK